MKIHKTQAHSQGGARGEAPPKNSFAPSGKMSWT